MSELISLEGMPVVIGMPVYNDIPHKTTMALCGTVQRCVEAGVKLDINMVHCGVITIGRDQVLDDFLKSGAQKLFWIDSDIVWAPDDFLRMLALSTKVDCVGAAYLQKVEGKNFFFYQAGNVQANEVGLFPVDGMGLGFTIVDRGICEELAGKSPKVFDPLNNREMAAVFRVDTANGLRRTEDMAFFQDIRDAGHTVWLDPSIELGHVGKREWRGRLLDAIVTPKGE
jgi:hypothetical protein